MFWRTQKFEKYEREQSIDGFFITSISNKKSFMNKRKSKNYENISNSNQIKKIQNSFFEVIRKHNQYNHKIINF